MTGNVAAGGVTGVMRPYFYLSYAHSDPLAGDPDTDPDELVGRFFEDLTGAVRQESRIAGIVPGFYDQEIPVGSDWRESLRQAMSAAQVFVPLYSAGYMAKSWPGREWACFRRRVELAGVDNTAPRFVPVLWTPLAGTQDPPGLRDALALGARERDYTENGLRPLLKIGSYRGCQAVSNALAKRIVTLAEKFPISPISPSEVPDIDKMESAFTSKHLSVFTIETAAPTVNTVVPEHGPGGYGQSSTDWRPFPQQELPLAEYARQVVERLDFKAEVSGISMVRDPRTRKPGIIVIDPWILADDDGRLALESAIENLPRWVLPVIVLDQPDDASTQKLADQVREILSTAGALPTNSSRRAATGVSSLDDFVSTVRVLAASAERQYLRYRSGRVPSPSSGHRPSLRGRLIDPASTPDDPASSPDRLGEKSDDA
jgi:FxsC-like protein